MIKISAIVLAVLVHAAAFAQPNVTGGFGNMTTDSTYTVTGTGFGVKTTPGPLLWDYLTNIEAYDSYGLDTGDLVPTGSGYPWRAQSAANACYAKIDGSRVPGRGTYFSLPKGGLNSWDWSLDRGIILPQLYISWWYKYPDNVAVDAGYPDDTFLAEYLWWSSSSSKVFRASSEYGNGSVPCDDTYCVLSNAGRWATWCNPTSACNVNTYTGSISYAPPNEWINIEAVMDSRLLDGCESHLGYAVSWWNNVIQNDDSGSTAKHWVLNDGRIYGGPSPISKVENWGFDPSVTSSTLTPPGYPSITWSTEGDTCMYTEVYIDSTQARVVIADNAVLEDATHKEIQIPTAWDGPGGEITFTANTGTFATDDVVYVFVINTDGVVSTGTLAATVGTEYSAPDVPGAPGRPTGLRATEND